MSKLVTVFRSADEDAQEQAAGVAEMLKSEGIAPSILDDHAPGVPEGAWEVQVSEQDISRADALIAGMQQEPPDESHDLDLVPVYRSGDGSSEGEMEILTVKNLLEAEGIRAVLVGGDVPIPSLGQEIRVPRENAEEARRVIMEALASGPAGAEEAEAESES